MMNEIRGDDVVGTLSRPTHSKTASGCSWSVRTRHERFASKLNTCAQSRVSMDELGSLTDAELVRRTLDGDEGAFGVLVRRYMRAAYAVAYSVTGKHEDAEDAAQESFMVALQRLEDCRSPERFGGWFMTIVRNRSRNLVRRESLRDSDPLLDSTGARGLTPDRSTEQAELRGTLTEGLEELSEVQRQVVLLHDLEGWKHREIGEMLGIPSGTVRSHLHFARKALRAFLKERLGGYEGIVGGELSTEEN